MSGCGQNVDWRRASPNGRAKEGERESEKARLMCAPRVSATNFSTVYCRPRENRVYVAAGFAALEMDGCDVRLYKSGSWLLLREEDALKSAVCWA